MNKENDDITVKADVQPFKNVILQTKEIKKENDDVTVKLNTLSFNNNNPNFERKNHMDITNKSNFNKINEKSNYDRNEGNF
jgi:hypothetical protein